MRAPPDDGFALDRRAVRRAFARAAATYDEFAVLQREVGKRMQQRLDYVKVAPRVIVDAGCGTGAAIADLGARYPLASIIGVDVALPMLAHAQARMKPKSWLARLGGRASPAPALVCADIAALPLRAASAGLVWSNLALQWIDDPAPALEEFARVLEVGGLVSFTTFGPDTLRELRAAFDDGRPHVSRFIDMHDLGDALVAAGFADPVMDMENITLTYATPRALLHELKAIGATNALAGRPRGLLGKGALARVEAALERTRRDGRIAATFEVVYGHAWRAQPRRTREGHAILHFDPAAHKP
ncbi:MAG: malonyl-ACP O-methyltransferase BioC [Betaproteobacteria bacterium]